MAELILSPVSQCIAANDFQNPSKQKKLQQCGPNYTTIHLSRDNAAWFSGFIKTLLPVVPAVFQEATFLFLRTVLD